MPDNKKSTVNKLNTAPFKAEASTTSTAKPVVDLNFAVTPEQKKLVAKNRRQRELEDKPQSWDVKKDYVGLGINEPGLEPSYPEMALLPGSLPIKAASKLGKAAVVAAETLNPISGFKNMSNQLNKATKGTNSVFKEIKGELKQGKANRESIKQGNEWLENWIKHPSTKEKININIDDKIDFAKQFSNYPLSETNLKIQFIKEIGV
jgi:hypothetical protein